MSALAVTTLPRMGEGEERTGARIRARRKGLGMTGAFLARLADVSREHLSEIESGRKEPSDEWLRRVDRALDRYEHETGQDEPAEQKPQVIRFVVEGVYGAKALVVEGPVENIAELEAAVDRIMRRLQGESGEQGPG